MICVLWDAFLFGVGNIETMGTKVLQFKSLEGLPEWLLQIKVWAV